MRRRPAIRSTEALAIAATMALLAVLRAQTGPLHARGQGAATGFNDAHFHLTNYVQEGIDAAAFLRIMGTRVGRSTLFGIPLQQQWSYANSGDFAPTYYLQSDAPLYYYSFTDAYIASVYRGLPQADQARLDPMITGFNPADMYGVDHIRRVLRTFPGVFTGIGEFSIHKEFVSAKVTGETASLTNPALDRILDFAAESGLVVILHNDLDMPFAKTDAEPVYLAQMKALLRRHPKTSIIWAHLGLGRIVHPVQVSADAAERSPSQVQIVEAMLTDPSLRHVAFDISWDEVAKYAIASPESIERVSSVLNRYPDRFLFGTDTVAPAGPGPYYAVFDLWAPVWQRLTPEASQKVRTGITNASSTKDGEESARGSRPTPDDLMNGGEMSMRLKRCTRLAGTRWLAAMLITVGVPWSARAQDKPTQQTTVDVTPAEPKPTLEIYGFAMLDIGHNFTQINPNWFDTLRVTRLPSFDKQFGEDNSTYAGVRQSRLGVRSSTPTSVGELKTIFEFELFGTGVDEGQTTFRLRHAWGELGRLGAGQYWSPFSDPDVYPNTLEYWGPTGIPWFRNVQLRYTPISTDHSNFMLALARPGASGDQGVYADRIELEGIRARFPLPDFAAAYKFSGKWGYVRTAGMLRRINWDDTLDDQFDLSGDATGWGWNVSSNLKHGEGDVLRMQLTVGEGIQNEMNDSPIDIGIARNLSNPVTPLVGEPIPIVAIGIFLDHKWGDTFTTAVGYSWQENDNTDAQAPDAFKTGHYALGNILYYPATNVMLGGELQWGRRENFSDGFSSDGVKLQFSFKYNFSWKMGD